MRRYDEKIDKTIIEILYESGRELTFKELKDRLEPRLDTFSYETYSNRLKQLSKVPTAEEKDNNKEQSRYVIQPVLNRKDEKRRGGKVYYSLTKPARIRCDLKLPILNNETRIEKAYRILSRSLAFENSPYRKLKDEDEYNTFLQKLGINEKELRLNGIPGYNRNLYKVTNMIHQESGIKFSHTEYLEGSEYYEKSTEYYYKLPGISIKEFVANNNEYENSKGLAYGHLDFNKDDKVNEYFKLLEDKKLIEKIKSRYLEILDGEDRYVMTDNKDTNRLKNFFRDCWLLHGSVTIYLYQKWKCIQPPTEEERIWYEHLWGKDRSNQIITSCYETRTKFNNKSKNVKSEKEDIQKQLKSQKIDLQRKFTSIKNKYQDIIDDYSYLANPLLNLVYPQFFRT